MRPRRHLTRKNPVDFFTDKVTTIGAGFVYCFNQETTNMCKIGWSWNPRKRRNDLQLASPLPLKILGLCYGDNPDENRIRKQAVKDGAEKMHGEWVKFQDLNDVEKYFQVGGGHLFVRARLAESLGRAQAAKFHFDLYSIPDRVGSVVKQISEGYGVSAQEVFSISNHEDAETARDMIAYTLCEKMGADREQIRKMWCWSRVKLADRIRAYEAGLDPETYFALEGFVERNMKDAA